MQDHLRAELLRRIERGILSVALLARQTGLGQSHLSNFLHQRGRLSLEAMDCILGAQRMAADDLLPSREVSVDRPGTGGFTAIPVVSHQTAMFEPVIRASVWQDEIHVSARVLQSLRPGATSARTKWERFVAVRISGVDAAPMEPVIVPDALAVLDRHYTSLNPYRGSRPTLYAVRAGSRLALRYVDFRNGPLIILRPGKLEFPVQVLETEPGEELRDLVVGRAALVLNEV